MGIRPYNCRSYEDFTQASISKIKTLIGESSVGKNISIFSNFHSIQLPIISN